MSKKIFVICHNIRSRHNVGSIFRTADGAGVSKIFLCGITPAPPHPNIEKVSLGAEKFVEWEKCKETWRTIEKLKKENFEIVALEQAKNAISLDRTDPPATPERNDGGRGNGCRFGEKIALVLGNEVEGLPPAILKRTDKIIQIPMRGKKESLNVAVAFGIAVYKLAEILYTKR